MRIRKRQVPLPLSSLSPVPLSDPLLLRSPVVQLHHTHDSFLTKPSPPPQNPSHGGPQTPFPPSDQANQRPSLIGQGSDGMDSLGDAIGSHKRKDDLEWLQREDDRGDMRNDIRKGSFLGAESVNEFVTDSVSSSQVGRWCDREKAFPPKKRRGSFEKKANEETVVMSDKNKKMKTKMNKKCTQQQQNDSTDEEQEIREPKQAVIINRTKNSKKRGGRGSGPSGAVLMEGSRCSRVNGRGWRCCQPTLVGYSLCEHHLGKGRLRSMNSVRNRSLVVVANASSTKDNTDTLSLVHEFKTKKKMKLGMVKARSMSSLLGQTNNVMAMADGRKES